MQILCCSCKREFSYNDTPSNITSASDSEYIHPHWLRYLDVIDNAPESLVTAIGVYVTVVSVVGVLGNLIVIVAFCRTPFLRKFPNYLIVNLAISDAAFSLTVGLPLISNICSPRRWRWGHTACHLYGFLGGSCGLNSIGSMTLIAFDRYQTVSRPFERLYKSTRQSALIKITIVWIWSMVIAVPPLFGWGSYIPEGFQMSCTFDYLTRTPSNIAYNYFLVIFGFLLPVSAISGFYAGIARLSAKNRTRRSTSSCRVHIGSLTSVDLERKKVEREAHLTKMMLVVVILFVVSWLPYAFVAQLGILGLSNLVTPYVAQIPVLLAKTSAVWNPIIYGLSGWSKTYWSRKEQRRQYNNWSRGILKAHEPEVRRRKVQRTSSHSKNTSFEERVEIIFNAHVENGIGRLMERKSESIAVTHDGDVVKFLRRRYSC